MLNLHPQPPETLATEVEGLKDNSMIATPSPEPTEALTAKPLVLGAIKVRDCMTSPAITTFGTVPISLAQNLMDEYNIRHLPVVEDNRLVGILSSGDIRRASPSDATSLSVWEVRYLWDKLRVSQVMTRNVIAIQQDSTILDAVKLMLEHRFGSLPVIDEDGILVGMLTEVDVFRLLVSESED